MIRARPLHNTGVDYENQPQKVRVCSVGLMATPRTGARRGRGDGGEDSSLRCAAGGVSGSRATQNVTRGRLVGVDEGSRMRDTPSYGTRCIRRTSKRTSSHSTTVPWIWKKGSATWVCQFCGDLRIRLLSWSRILVLEPA